MTSTSAASEPATRGDLEALRTEFREDMAAHRAEFREDMATLRAEFREDMAAHRQEFREDMGEFRADMRTWAAISIGLNATVLVGTIGAIVTTLLSG